MNDNLKAVWNKAASSHVQSETSWETKQNFLVRFAELVISECATIAENNTPTTSREVMKKHFGVSK